mmetsp:Transcript_12319/g.17730  ORF Transcript_12319/g.17730 Transcript_12319/m.17730 type:complete len:179 (+) Transcript_12319:146-682(+)
MWPTFVYGTLMAEEVIQGLIGRVPTMSSPAFLPGYSRWSVVNQVYPGIVKHDSTSILTDATVDDIILFNEMTNMPIVEGKLLLGLTPNEMKIFDWFEEVNIMYKRDVVRVAVDKHWVDAEAYIWLLGDEQKTSYILDTSTKWCYKIFREKYLHTYLLQTVASCRKEIQRLKIGTPDLS